MLHCIDKLLHCIDKLYCTIGSHLITDLTVLNGNGASVITLNMHAIGNPYLKGLNARKKLDTKDMLFLI